MSASTLAAANTTGYSTVTASYNDAGRLQTLTNGASTETSVYNALGQRIEISGGVNGTVLYAYDEAGHLLGEYDATGALIEETVWLGDIPVATLHPNGSTVSIYYVHTDQLNTPRQITRPSDHTPMWTWNSDPFGTDAANPNPASAGAFAYNPRFPGRAVPIGASVCALLQTYIVGVRKDWPGADRDRHLFLNRFGQGMGPNAVWHVVHKYARAANIDRAVSTHTFRHSCATHMLRAGAPIRHLQEMLGHASIETTQIYTRVTITDLKAVHRRFHPRERSRDDQDAKDDQSALSRSSQRA